MTRKLPLVLAALAIAAAAACSSTSTTATSNTSGPAVTSASGSSSTEKKDTTTEAPNDTKKTPGTSKTTGTSRTSGTSKRPTTKTPITKPASTTSIEKSKLPTKSQSASDFGGLTAEESDCVDTVIYGVVSDDPTIADDDNRLAGATGGALVACVDPDKLAAALVSGLKQTPAGSKLDSFELGCVEGMLSTGGDEEAYLIGALIIEDPAVIADAVAFYEEGCGVRLT